MKKDVSRREFAKNLAKFLIFGGLSHFSLSTFSGNRHTGKDCPGGGADFDECRVLRYTSNGVLDTDYCPGGKATEDICDPYNGLRDYCPGGQIPEDDCSITGLREVMRDGAEMGADDECDTGFADADICDNTIEESDQCPAQNSITDVCDATQGAKFDVCWSGLEVDDKCVESGGKATDECPGGGWERDTCKILGASSTVIAGAIVPTLDSEGDECSEEGKAYAITSDSCAPRWNDGIVWPEDQCGIYAADVCYEGTNSIIVKGPFNGGEDLCMGKTLEKWVPGHGGDTCLDGSDGQDDCGGINGDPNNSKIEVDVCLPSAVGEKDDHCGSVMEYHIDVGSSDVCYIGKIDTDECKPDVNDKDECPGGGPETDVCMPGVSDEDECPGGGPAVDECLPGTSDSDECAKHGVCGLDKCTVHDGDTPIGCTSSNPDYAE